MIYIPKYTTAHIDLPKCKAEYSGHFKFETFKTDSFDVEIPGSRRVRAEFDNIILNQGLNYVSDFGGFIEEVAVGTGNTPEAITDTTLVAFTAGESVTTSNSFTAEGTPPYFGSITHTWRFGEGEAAGILAEAGIGRGNCNVDGSDLWSRALIKDGAGDPTTIEVQADEWLDVAYQLRLYPGHLADASGSVLISGASHNYVLRNALVTSGSLWGAYLQSQFPVNNGSGEGKVYAAGSVLQDVTQEPTATQAALVGRTPGSYSAFSYTQDCNWSLGLDDGNLTGGFECMTFNVNVGIIQMSLDPVVAKDNTKVFDFTVNWAWGNRVAIP